MSLTPNEKLLHEAHSQLNNKMSWLFTHIADTILDRPVEWFGFNGATQPKGSRNTVTLRQLVGWFDSGLQSLATGIRQANETLAGIKAALEALSKRQGIDPADLAKVIDAAVEKSADKHLADIGNYQLVRVEALDLTPEEKK